MAAMSRTRGRAPSTDRPHRLLVEGPDDKWAIIALLERHGLSFDAPWMPHVHDAEGVDGLLMASPIDAKNHPRLGIVLDADLDVASRWQALRDRLRGVDIDVPASPPRQGLTMPGFFRDYRLGVWLMPDNHSTGMLEDFLARLIAPGEPTWAHACEATTRARELGAPLSALHQSKGALHAWLAWRDVPGKPFGTAITARYLQHDTPEALAFLAWFQGLFAPA